MVSPLRLNNLACERILVNFQITGLASFFLGDSRSILAGEQGIRIQDAYDFAQAKAVFTQQSTQFRFKLDLFFSGRCHFS